MEDNKTLNYIKDLLENVPSAWLNLTTHRLDIYNEKLAKTQFLDQLDTLFQNNNTTTSALDILPTAYDYIRLGHPLSCVLEWGIAKLNNLNSENVISFSSQTIPVLAVLRKNLLENKKTRIIYLNKLPKNFDSQVIKKTYNYNFELEKVVNLTDISAFNGSTIFISQEDKIGTFNINKNVDFFISLYKNLGSILVVNGAKNENYVSDIQHVRRRETIAMTPSNSLIALKAFATKSSIENKDINEANKISVVNSIKEVTGSNTKPLVASSGLSIQYAI